MAKKKKTKRLPWYGMECTPGILRLKRGDRFCVMSRKRGSDIMTRVVSCHKTLAAATTKASAGKSSQHRYWVIGGNKRLGLSILRKRKVSCVAQGRATR